MEELELYILRIPGFSEKKQSEMIDFFAFYLQHKDAQNAFTAVQIKECFDKLSIPPYSNISSYLSKNSGSKKKYIKQKTGYILNRFEKEKIASEVGEPVERPLSSDLIDISIFEYAPYYLIEIAKEMIHTYDSGYYNATLVLMRKLIETMIVECYERYGIDAEIKDATGTFYELSGLIPKYLSSNKWNVSRNINKSMESVKKFGDLSAHNRRFLAKKSDIDSFRFELRQALQEILLTIDYPHWKRT